MADKSNIIDFRDGTFSSTLQTKLNQYRKEKNLTDVELQIGDKLFPAHRAVLSAGSPVLEAAFSENWTQSKIYPISDEYVDPEIVEDLLNFFYTGSIQLTPDNVHSVCVAAHFLQIPTLLRASVKGLSKQVTFENVLTLFVFSNSRDLNVLQKTCLRFISTNYFEVFQNSQILQLSSKDFTDLIVWLKSKCCGTTVREDTFECIVRWTEMNLMERSEAFPVLLENIPLDEMPFRSLTQTVFTHPLVKESFPCIQNILESLKLSSFEAASDQIPSTLQDLIVIGGRKASDRYSSVMNYYHADSQTWRRLPDMLQKREDFAVTVNKQRDVFVSGGYLDNTEQRTGSVEMFSWESQTWQTLPEMPVVITGHSMTIHNGYLYVAGGFQNKDTSSKVWRFSFEKSEWSQVQNMWDYHYAGSLVLYKDHLYVIGAFSKFVERYDPMLNEWKKMTSMTYARTVKATVHQEKIYICITTTPYGRPYTPDKDLFEIYDPETDVRTSLPDSSIEGFTSLVSLNGKLLAVCRIQNGHSIHEFDLTTKQWTKFADIPSNIFPLHAVVGDY